MADEKDLDELSALIEERRQPDFKQTFCGLQSDRKHIIMIVLKNTDKRQQSATAFFMQGGEQNAMSKVEQNGPFFKLDEKRQEAVKLLFEDDLTDVEIAKNVQRSRSTLNNWKNDPLFKAAQEQYARMVVKDYKNDALKKVHELLNARSEMVQLQSATTILKMAGYLSDNSTPELDEAKVRKLKAEADIAEAKAKSMNENGDRVVEKIDKLFDKVLKEVPKNDD